VRVVGDGQDGAMADPDAPAIPDTIVGISFGDLFRAQEFLTASNRLVAQQQIELRDAVIIMKDDDGRAVVRETLDPQPGRSALSGGAWAGLFGLLLGGPVGWIAGTAIGAGAGAITAKVVDLGVPDEWVDWFRDAVQPGTATVVLLLGHYDAAATTAELERFSGAQLVYANLAPDAVARIRRALGDEVVEEALTTPPDPSTLAPAADTPATPPE